MQSITPKTLIPLGTAVGVMASAWWLATTLAVMRTDVSYLKSDIFAVKNDVKDIKDALIRQGQVATFDIK